MKVRLISGIVIGILLVTMLLSGSYVLGLGTLVLSVTAYYELCRAGGMAFAKKVHIPFLVGFLGIFLHYVLLLVGGGANLFLGVVLGLLILLLVLYVFFYPRYSIREIELVFFNFCYAPLMLSFLYLLRTMPHGKFLCWIPFAAWICDSFAYFTGMRFGKHKLTPLLSPKKTVEGAVGGILGAMLSGGIYGLIVAGTSTGDFRMVPGFILMSLAVALFSQIGDLVASGIKREHKIKDYSRLIPGHGGMMDRFDSVIFATPLVYAIAKVWFG